MDKPFELSNGYVIIIGKYCSRCPETLFQPVYLRQTSTGVHEISVIYCIPEIHNTMYIDIVISGGNTITTWDLLTERIAQAPPTQLVKIISHPHAIQICGS